MENEEDGEVVDSQQRGAQSVDAQPQAGSLGIDLQAHAVPGLDNKSAFRKHPSEMSRPKSRDAANLSRHRTVSQVPAFMRRHTAAAVASHGDNEVATDGAADCRDGPTSVSDSALQEYYAKFPWHPHMPLQMGMHHQSIVVLLSTSTSSHTFFFSRNIG